MPYVVRLRGMPFSMTDRNIMDFLDVDIVNGSRGIHKERNQNGGWNGAAFIELHSMADRTKCAKKHKANFGTRYIEVFPSNMGELYNACVQDKIMGGQGPRYAQQIALSTSTVIRMRGLPYDCSRQDVAHFFQGLHIIQNGILIPVDDDGKVIGKGYVEFATSEDAERALELDKQKIGKRYIEIFEASKLEMIDVKHTHGDNVVKAREGNPYGAYRSSRVAPPPGPTRIPPFPGRALSEMRPPSPSSYGRMGAGEDMMRPQRGLNPGPPAHHRPQPGMNRAPLPQKPVQPAYKPALPTENYPVLVKNLKFGLKDWELAAFFDPIKVKTIRRELQPNGRYAGSATIDFKSYKDAMKAMTKHKTKLGDREVVLYYKGQGIGSLNSQQNDQQKNVHQMKIKKEVWDDEMEVDYQDHYENDYQGQYEDSYLDNPARGNPNQGLSASRGFRRGGPPQASRGMSRSGPPTRPSAYDYLEAATAYGRDEPVSRGMVGRSGQRSAPYHDGGRGDAKPSAAAAVKAALTILMKAGMLGDELDEDDTAPLGEYPSHQQYDDYDMMATSRSHMMRGRPGPMRSRGRGMNSPRGGIGRY